MDQIRNSLGICPQHDVLFEELTVEEHLKFFCKLNGIEDVKRINHEVIKYSKMLGISDKLKSQRKTLSGGQKRRLSVAIALCGDSKFVMIFFDMIEDVCRIDFKLLFLKTGTGF